MSEVKITDAGLEAELRNAKNDVMLKGADGRYLGMYTPIDVSSMDIGITEEELERRLNDPNAKWLTTQEVIDRLRSL